MNFSGKTIFITGASAGIGAECAKQFHDLGASLVLVARRRESLEALAEPLNARRVNSVRLLPLDLCLESDLAQCERILKEEHVDILVNNAGRGSFGYFEALPLEVELQMIDLNVKATVRLAHAVIPQMKARRDGAILAVSSIAGFEPIPYMSTYAATKAFNLFHALGLRNELAEFGVRVVTLCPGPTDTEFGGVARVPGTATGISRDRVEDVVAAAIRALEHNSAFVVPGARSWGLSVLSRILPIVFTTWLTGKMLRPVVKETNR